MPSSKGWYPTGHIYARDIRVTIDKNAMGRLFSEAGPVGGEAREIANRLLNRAITRARRGTGRKHAQPIRAAGNLKKSHSVSVTNSPSAVRPSVKITLKNSADYALFVHEGTAGKGLNQYDAGAGSSGYGFFGPRRFRPGGGARPMARPMFKGSNKTFWVYEVKGQAPKRWMIRAANDVLSKYKAINYTPFKSHVNGR